MNVKISLPALLCLTTLQACAAPAPTCGLTAVAQLPVTYIAGHLPVVPATIAGQPVQMMVDSGAGDSILTPHAYDRLNLFNAHSFDISASGVSGDMQDNNVVMQNLMLGQTKLDDDVLVITNFGGLQSKYPNVDGVIGEDALHRFDVAWDLPDNEITLFAKPSCVLTQTPWPGDYAQSAYTDADVGAPLLTVQINGQNLPAIIDSGAYATLLQQSDLDAAGITPQALSTPQNSGVTGINGKAIGGKIEQFSSLTIGAESISNIWLTVADSHASAHIPSLIGEDFLSTHRVFIDTANHTAFIGLTVANH